MSRRVGPLLGIGAGGHDPGEVGHRPQEHGGRAAEVLRQLLLDCRRPASGMLLLGERKSTLPVWMYVETSV